MFGAFSITTWNVNSVRSRLDHVLTYLSDHEPEILCLQETKVEDALFPRVPFLELGYHVTVHGSKGLAGVATLTKAAPQEVVRGFQAGEPDRHCRILNTKIEGVRVYNLYCPNGTAVGSDPYVYKLEWFRRLRAELDAQYSTRDPVLLVGDFNVAPDDRDLWAPDEARGQLLVSEPERAALAHLQAFGLVDCFRQFCPDAGRYTWFDYRTNGFERNEGMRIDHVYATAPLAECCREVVHDLTPRGWSSPSDHIPVSARFEPAGA